MGEGGLDLEAERMAACARDEFGDKYALTALARALIDTAERLELAERGQSHGYHRRSPDHPVRRPKPALPDPVTDEWIESGRSS